jgi:hypothetical protein
MSCFAGVGRIEDRGLPAGFVRSMQKYSAHQKQAAVQHNLDHDRFITRRLCGADKPDVNDVH